MQGSSCVPDEGASNFETVVVDDDQLTLDLLAAKFRRVGAGLQCFEDCDDALAFLQGHDVQALLVDLRMPGTSGIEFLERLAALDVMPPAVFIASAIELPEDAAIAARRLGAQYLSKDHYRDVVGLRELISRSLSSS